MSVSSGPPQTEAALEDWIGRSESADDVIMGDPLARFAAMLDREGPEPRSGTNVPPGGHWLYFLTRARQSEIGADGHPERGGFMPPVALPRRMFAGARYDFRAPLRVGMEVTRTSEILSLKRKQGKSGALVFVTVRHDYVGAGGAGLTEEQDIVYRAAPQPGAPVPTPPAAPRSASWTRTIRPDPVLLFRYSALTFNGHRIHYDRDYCRDVEGYPGLVVQGPLIATFLMDLCARERPDAFLRRFTFRAVSPLFDTGPFTVNGAPGEDGGWDLWAANPGGGLAMQASAEFAA